MVQQAHTYEGKYRCLYEFVPKMALEDDFPIIITMKSELAFMLGLIGNDIY